MRVVPLYVNFGAESFRDHIDIGSHDFYDRLRAAPRCRRPRSRRRRTSSTPTSSSRATSGSTRCSSREALRHVPVGRHRRRDDGRRPDPRRRHRDGVARGGTARARDPAPPRARHDRRGDRGADRALQGGERRRLHRRDPRVPAEGRPDRAGAGARRHAAEREADPLRSTTGSSTRSGKVRGRAEGARGVRRVFTSATRGQRRGCGSRSRTPRRPSGSRCSPTSPRRRARRREIELVENLGAVVGTHAGPGAVGFFWFQDE